MLNRLLPMVLLVLLVTACGGSSGGGSDDNNAQAPVARAGADTTEVAAGETTVHLDGSDSSSPNGDITSWDWRFLSRPEGSEAEIDNADAPQARFTPDVPGEYVVRLIVGDGAAESEDTQASRVSVNATNPDPVAVVPDEINWIVGTVQLDGSRSQPPEGGDPRQLVYDWTLTQKPEGSEAQMDSGNLVYPRFTADKVGLYQAELVVSYAGRTSEPATVDINIVEANAAPMAEFEEPDEPITRGETVTLDGSASQDADGDSLQYRWRFTNKPDGSSAELSSTTTAQTSFTADAMGGGYSLELCVFDGVSRDCARGGVDNDLVKLPEDAENTPPVAVIGPDYYNDKTFEAELGAKMRLDSNSYDVDGDELSETWRFVSYPDGYDPEANADLDAGWSAGFTPTEEGDYTVELEVSDGQATDTATQTYTAMLGANRSPSAEATTASGNTTTLVGQQITLDGEGSSDPDDNRLSYEWAIQQRPDGSEAELQGADTAHPTLTPDAPGPYVVSLVVTDEHGWSSTYRPNYPSEVVVLAKASNHPPVTRIRRGTAKWYEPLKNDIYDTEQPLAITGRTEDCGGGTIECRLDAFVFIADSYDPDGDALSHLWTLAGDEPEGNRMEFNGESCANGEYDVPQDGGENNIGETKEEYLDRIASYREWTCQTIGLAPTEPGTYVLEYQVHDGSEFAGPYTATAHAVMRENYPSLLLEESRGGAHVRESDDSDLVQKFFPYVRGLVPTSVLGEDEVGTAYFRLTAFGGDYTLVDVETHSDDPDHIPRFVDVTNDQEITSGYVLEQGESIVVGFKVPVGLSRPEYGISEAKTKLNNANIHGSFRIQEKDGWTVTIEPDF